MKTTGPSSKLKVAPPALALEGPGSGAAPVTEPPAPPRVGGSLDAVARPITRSTGRLLGSASSVVAPLSDAAGRVGRSVAHQAGTRATDAERGARAFIAAHGVELDRGVPRALGSAALAAATPVLDPVLSGVTRLEEAVLPGPPRALKRYPKNQIDAVLPVAGPETGLPEQLQGIFWLRGLKLPDVAMTLAGATFDPATRTSTVEVAGPKTWAFYGNALGTALYAGARASRLHYHVTFDEGYRHGNIRAVNHFGPLAHQVPEAVVKLTMDYEKPTVWHRTTKILGHEVDAWSYSFTRIVNGKGEREPAFADFLREAPDEIAVAEPTGK